MNLVWRLKSGGRKARTNPFWDEIQITDKDSLF